MNLWVRSVVCLWYMVRDSYSLVFYVVSCVILFVCLSSSFLAMALSVCFRFMSLTVPLVSFVHILQSFNCSILIIVTLIYYINTKMWYECQWDISPSKSICLRLFKFEYPFGIFVTLLRYICYSRDYSLGFCLMLGPFLCVLVTL